MIGAALAAMIMLMPSLATAQPSPPTEEAPTAAMPVEPAPARDSDPEADAPAPTSPQETSDGDEKAPEKAPENASPETAAETDETPNAAADAPPAEQAGSQDAAPADTADQSADPAPASGDETAADAAAPAAETSAQVGTAASGTSDNGDAAQEATATQQGDSDAPAASPVGPLRITVWPGAFGEAQRTAVVARFKDSRPDADLAVRSRPADAIADISSFEGFDTGEFSREEVAAGCKSGAFARLKDEEKPQPAASATEDDFLPGSLTDCGIGAFAWAHVIAFHLEAFQKSAPERALDLFDTRRFPGKRALIDSPRYLFEVALAADGVAAADIYPALATAEGRKRALAMISRIRDDIIWVGSAAEALDKLQAGEAVMAQAFNGRAFHSAARGAPVGLIWDKQIYAMSYWAVNADSPRRAKAVEFVRFATEPRQLAAVAELFPYGPTRSSATAMATRHQATGLRLDGFLPTLPGRIEGGVAFDATFWSRHEEAARRELEEMRNAEPEEPTIPLPRPKPE